MKRWIKRNATLLLLAVCVLTMGADPWGTFTPSPMTSARTGFNPTQHDSTAEPGGVCKAFWVEAAGDVSFVTADGSSITCTVLAGQELKYQVLRFNNTGTTLTDAQINCYGK